MKQDGKKALVAALSCVWLCVLPACLPEVVPPNPTDKTTDSGRSDVGEGDGGGLGDDAGDAGDVGDTGPDAERDMCPPVDPACADGAGDFCVGEGSRERFSCIERDGCLVLEPLVACNYGQGCEEGACSTCIDDVSVDVCKDEESFACLGSQRQECVVEANGCPSSTLVVDCSDEGEFCEAGECVECPSVPGCEAEDQLTCGGLDGLTPLECQRDGSGCLVAVDSGEDPCVDGSTYCDNGQCLRCDEYDTACLVEGEIVCDPNAPDQIPTCRKQPNGCLTLEVGVMDYCGSGTLCDEVEPLGCSPCSVEECIGITANAPAYCEPGINPRAYVTCDYDQYGCGTVGQPAECSNAQFCDDSGLTPFCESCSNRFGAEACNVEGATRCAPGVGGAPSTVTQRCAPDPTTGCLKWFDDAQCEQVGSQGGVCVGPGQVIDPRQPAGTATTALCVPNECSGSIQRCSNGGDVATCTTAPDTGWRYYDVTEVCSPNQECGDTADTNVKACICQHTCTPGDVDFTVRCGTNGLTQMCRRGADMCRVYVDQTVSENPCNAPARVFGDRVECRGTGLGVCQPFTGDNSCLESFSQNCNVGSCNPTGSFPDGAPQYSCQ